MKNTLLKFLLFSSIPLLIYACKPVENYPMRTVIIAFNWEKCNSLDGRVIVLDRYPLEPPVYGSTRNLKRNSKTDTTTYLAVNYRGNLTFERYDNPENFSYASVKESTAIPRIDTVEIVLWDVLNTQTN
ncbi:hypothetical protein KMW28_14665 [Flammeovirga yaeyamensis]|uniref:Lipoprotein n=1 Tax=Flammeovirga yaeyamensis TaxID=367791 RepID=A0AAX1N066_9BACT|nr:hypothetical protein [Flammeovirga yaeyamensis]MBB3700165.1 hypothetical protein [Flammeovirga yaeyamensis]NMF37205.1 hypothetical protein [Flammeovirga yaeyamensis]QWG00894.1 hypothetical protein KMW28_14665 [Flammeovirga yaeyamensis]